MRWPKYKKAYLHAFEKMIEQREKRGLSNWKTSSWATATDVFNWWMEYDVLPGQYNMFEDVEEENLAIEEFNSWA